MTAQKHSAQNPCHLPLLWILTASFLTNLTSHQLYSKSHFGKRRPYLDRSQNQLLRLTHKARRDSSHPSAVQQTITFLRLSYHSMGFRTVKIVRKRQLDSGRAKRQQQDRRKESLFKKAYGYSLECDADVYISIKIRKNGQVFTFNSDSTREWPLSEAQIVRFPPSGSPIFMTSEALK